jgi:hypothetical protein
MAMPVTAVTMVVPFGFLKLFMVIATVAFVHSQFPLIPGNTIPVKSHFLPVAAYIATVFIIAVKLSLRSGSQK